MTGPVFAGDFLGGSAPAATLSLSLQDYSAGVLPRTRRGHDDVVELGGGRATFDAKYGPHLQQKATLKKEKPAQTFPLGHPDVSKMTFCLLDEALQENREFRGKTSQDVGRKLSGVAYKAQK